MLFSLGLVIVLICVATAAACGVFIFLSHAGGMSCAGVGGSESGEFCAVGTYYDGLSDARGAAASVRQQGRAGYVHADERGYFLVYAVYSDADDALAVADRLGAVTLDVGVPSLPLSAGDGEAYALLIEVAERSETLWRELDAGETSESLVSVTLDGWSRALGECETENGELTSLVTQTRTALLTAATAGGYPLTSEVKYLAAEIVFRLNAFAADAA